MSPALLILSIESLGACMREEQKRISFSFLKKKEVFYKFLCAESLWQDVFTCVFGAVLLTISGPRGGICSMITCADKMVGIKTASKGRQ